MIPLLHAELLKLRTTRTFVAFVGLAIVTSLSIATLVAILTEPTADSVLNEVFAADTSSFFILLLAVVGITGEWRHRTITSALLAAPNRVRFLTAKTLAFAVAGVVLSLTIAVSVAVVAATVLSIRDLPLPGLGELLLQILRNLFVAAALGALGVTFGALIRNQIAAVVGLVLIMFVVEPLVVGLVPSVGRFAPFGVLPGAAAGLSEDDSGFGDTEMLGSISATLMLIVWIAVLLALAAVLLVRRDLE